MRRIWNYISYLGLSQDSKSLLNRNIIVANRLNFVLLILTIFLNIVTTIIREMNHGLYTIHTKKILVLMIVCILNILFSRFKFHSITKVTLIFFPSLIIVLIPIFLGFIQEDDYIYNPLIIIAASLVPQLILEPKLSNKLYFISLLFYLIEVLVLFKILIYFTPADFEIIHSAQSFQIYFTVILLTVFFFIHFSMYYLRNLNYTYEHELNEYNEELLSTIEELKITQQQLIQSEKMASLGTLTAGIAHEINNPLNFIIGGIHLISDIKEQIMKSIPDEIKEDCELGTGMINTGFERVSRIVNALMTFSDRGTPFLTPFNIIDIIENTLLFMNSRIPSDIEIRKMYEFKGEIPMFPGKMHQVIMNILDNAIYSLNQSKQKKKKIVISTKLIKDKCILTISNNGPSIDEKHLNQIFDPFFTTKEPGEGIGLGLSICYTLISEHHGKIYANNSKDGVSTIIEIPAFDKVASNLV